MAYEAMNHVSLSQIVDFLKDFTKDNSSHLVGSDQSLAFVRGIRDQWTDFGLTRVELDPFVQKVPSPSKIPSAIRVTSSNGTELWNLKIDERDIHKGKVCRYDTDRRRLAEKSLTNCRSNYTTHNLL